MAGTLRIDDSILNTETLSSKVPPGIYKVKIAKCASDVVEWPENVRFKWGFNITDGLTNHGTLQLTTTFKEGAQFGLGRLLNAVGFDVARLHDKEFTEASFEKMRLSVENEVKGKELAVLVADSAPSNKSGKVYSNIEQTYPVDEFDELSKSVNYQPQKQAGVPAPGVAAEEIEDLAKMIDADW